ncbi:MAG: putative repeat protein (TIGR01451 family) [Oleispira sp.]
MPLTHFNIRRRNDLYEPCINICARLTLLGKHLIAGFLAIFMINFSASAEDIILRHSFAGNISFELTGNSQRFTSNDNGLNVCQNLANSSNPLSLPSGSEVEAAFLYWSGSGAADNTVTFQTTSVTANPSDIYTLNIGSQNFFSAKADVTSLVSDSTNTYTVSNLTFNTNANYCNIGRSYGGWALTVVYKNDIEPIRVVNIFDGFRDFRGQSLDLVTNNFIIANNPGSLGGKNAHITWEGDLNNSDEFNNQTESLKFNGTGSNNVNDFVDLSGTGNPTDNQFNSYSNTVVGITDGVDIDEYEIGSLLTPGTTSIITRYSSGQDRVFLTAEIISIPNQPVANLRIQQAGPSRFIRGQNNDVNFSVRNLGPNTAPSNTQLKIPLLNGLSLATFSGSDWNCSSDTTEISCIYQEAILINAFASALTISFSADQSTANSIALVSTITGIIFDNILSNNTQSNTYMVVSADVTTSTKTVTDLNGGNVQAGDTLRYNIEIKETNGIDAVGGSLTDHLDSNIASFTLVNLPNSINNSSAQAPSGDNGSGVILLSNITVPANSTVSITVDALLKSSLGDDATINNSAIISFESLADTSIVSPEVFVSRPVSPSAGNKPLYLRQNNKLTRIKPTSTAFISIPDEGQNTWAIDPSFQQEFRFSGTEINTYLFLQNSFTQGSWNHTLDLTLLLNGSPISVTENNTVTVPSQGLAGDNVGLFNFSFTIPTGQVFQPGDALSLRINNDSDYAIDNLHLYSIDPNPNNSDTVSPNSLISLPAETVINVDQISIIDSESSQPITESFKSQDISIEATVSDPFGSFDITSTLISIQDPLGTMLVNQQNMSLLTDSGVATKTFTYAYSLPDDAEIGDWVITVTSKEGTENEIEHSSQSILKTITQLANISVAKFVEVFSDPIVGVNSVNKFSKALPGAILTYTINAQNAGPGIAEDNSIWISDVIPNKTHMLIKDFDDIDGQGPVIEQPVNPNSGLSYQFITLDSDSDNIEFSNNNGDDFEYDPIPNGDGVDKNITHFRVNPTGSFQAPVAGESTNQFSIKFRVQLQ